MNDIIIGFTGTQNGMTAIQYRKVKRLISIFHPREVHHGDCIGADKEFHDIVNKFDPNINKVIHPPIDPKKRAFCAGDLILPAKDYIPRNHDIVDASRIMIATPKENVEKLRSGTWTTIRYSKSKVPVIIIYPLGEIEEIE